jgi:methylase of polypeptide subunit release factors
MIREIRTGEDVTILNDEFTKGLGQIQFYHPIGTFALTPASNILIDAIISQQNLLFGTGIDWGSGVGCLGILAAKIKSVNRVYGLEISEANINAAIKNAEINDVEDKVSFMNADSYNPFDLANKQELERNKGKINFILANPPSSEGDDGFEFRRIVLKGAKDYLCKDGIVFLNASFQYGAKRVEELYKNIGDFDYMGIAATTACVPFDLNRQDLLDCLKIYAREEQNGGLEYTFFAEQDENSSNRYINAQTALADYYKKGKSPWTKWQTHIFKLTT